jgi:hypothetical protein
MNHRVLAGAAALLALSLSLPDARAADSALSACIAANEASIQLRSDHKLLQARAQALKCAGDACPAVMRDVCKKRVDQVNAAIPKIVFDVKDAAGSDVAAKVTVDGQPAVSLQGAAIALDPGEHTFSFQAPGQPPVERSFILREGEQDRHERIVVGVPGPQSSARAAAGPSSSGSAHDSSPEPPPPTVDQGAHGWSGQRTAALVVGGLGVAGIVAGSVFGLMSRSAWSSSQSECPSPANCPQYGQAVRDHDSATSSAMISTIAFAAGAVGIAAGAVLWVTSPSAEAAGSAPRVSVRVAPAAGPKSAGVVVGGAF